VKVDFPVDRTCTLANMLQKVSPVVPSVAQVVDVDEPPGFPRARVNTE
jgi:hypothetical protein